MPGKAMNMAICKSELATRPISYMDTLAGNQTGRDDLWAVTTDELNAAHAESDRLRAAIVWALGAGDDFKPQGTMQGKYWWRGELAERAGLEWDGEKYAPIERPNEGGLELLREAVIERRDCHKAYSEFTASIAGRFPTREERDKEVALRSALGLAERAVMDAAEALTPNAELSVPRPLAAEGSRSNDVLERTADKEKA